MARIQLDIHDAADLETLASLAADEGVTVEDLILDLAVDAAEHELERRDREEEEAEDDEDGDDGEEAEEAPPVRRRGHKGSYLRARQR